mmetsp:Transcript_60588/g.163369  ORF Transcript_60588/g.163369 Transcript_60588/m.163369 type:complete len:230 (+) Transcript_60588:172-861(+)
MPSLAPLCIFTSSSQCETTAGEWLLQPRKRKTWSTSVACISPFLDHLENACRSSCSSSFGNISRSRIRSISCRKAIGSSRHASPSLAVCSSSRTSCMAYFMVARPRALSRLDTSSRCMCCPPPSWNSAKSLAKSSENLSSYSWTNLSNSSSSSVLYFVIRSASSATQSSLTSRKPSFCRATASWSLWISRSSWKHSKVALHAFASSEAGLSLLMRRASRTGTCMEISCA